VPGLGISLGRGGATTFQQNLEECDCIVIQGSNFAECHPVGFRWVMKAKERGALVIHVDPRFTRTSAMADLYVPIRAGTDIAFLGGLINHVLTNDLWFKEYVLAYTNAATVVDSSFQDAEDLDGLFSGYDPEARRYDPTSWRYAPEEVASSPAHIPPGRYTRLVADLLLPPPKTDPTLRDPRCVFQILKRHYARYTPEMVEELCGTPKDLFLKVARAITENSGRERTTAFCYAVGWTQHTVGVQYIRTAAILQLLLGNIGRPGGGILALRGHASIQGSTDIPTLYHSLPGYLPMPSGLQPHDTLEEYLRSESRPTGWWFHTPKYLVSLLKAWFGDAARPETDFCYDWLPKIIGDHSHLPMFVAALQGTLKGLFVLGQNPAVGGQNAGLQRRGLGQLDWLVVRDFFQTETAAFWLQAPEFRDDPRAVRTEVFLLPAAAAAEKEGSFTNTQRLIQWHAKTADPPGDARSEPWFLLHLGRRLKRRYAESREIKDRPIQHLTWEYLRETTPGTSQGPDEPDVEKVLKEINGYTWPGRQQVKGFTELQDDGSTACGCWIYSGVYPEEGRNLAAARTPGGYTSPGWGFAWPANRRILYNRASADPEGRPWSERKKLVWWDAEAARWTGLDVPDFPVTKAPGYVPSPGALATDAHAGADPFIMQPDGRGWLFAPSGLKDGPLPTHYEPVESPVPNLLYPRVQFNPVAKLWQIPGNEYAPPLDERYPIILSTYRLTEHYLAGGMSRWLPALAELMPALFVEMSPELAGERGIGNGDWVTVSSPRGEVEARALVTRRMRPFRVGGRVVHQIGMPWHWGYMGVVTGDVVNNLSALVADPNVTIHEGKVFVCNLRSGRRERR
jgi:formate dehydrogenase major subunit